VASRRDHVALLRQSCGFCSSRFFTCAKRAAGERCAQPRRLEGALGRDRRSAARVSRSPAEPVAVSAKAPGASERLVQRSDHEGCGPAPARDGASGRPRRTLRTRAGSVSAIWCRAIAHHDRAARALCPPARRSHDRLARWGYGDITQICGARGYSVASPWLRRLTSPTAHIDRFARPLSRWFACLTRSGARSRSGRRGLHGVIRAVDIQRMVKPRAASGRCIRAGSAGRDRGRHGRRDPPRHLPEPHLPDPGLLAERAALSTRIDVLRPVGLRPRNPLRAGVPMMKMHLIVTSRADPPLPLARLRVPANNRYDEIRHPTVAAGTDAAATIAGTFGLGPT